MLERRTSSGATSAGDGGPSPSDSIISSSRRRLRRPISPKSWRTVVSGGVKYCASGMSSKPTTLTSPRDLAARLVQRAQHAERHLVVGDEDRASTSASPRQLPAELVARARAPVADQHRRRLGAGRRRASTRQPSMRCCGLEEVGAARRCAQTVAVAELEQVLRGESPRRRTGRRRRPAARRRARPRPPRAGGRAGRSTSASRRALLRGDHEDAVDALHAQPLDGAQHRGAVERLEADDA